MESEDIINLENSASASESGELHDSDYVTSEADSQLSNFHAKNHKIELSSQEQSQDDVETTHPAVATGQEKSSVDGSSILEVRMETTETVVVEEKLDNLSTRVHSEAVTLDEKMDHFSSRAHPENGHFNMVNGSPIQEHMLDGSSIYRHKRPRMTFDDKQPSVHVIYNSLTRASKRKLQELLQQWSEWQAENGPSPSDQDPNEVVESGEETYFPALRIGKEKSSAVSFWIDGQTNSQLDKDPIALDSDAAPLYDRGYAMGLISADDSSNLEGGLEIIEDASRCFNCGSYSHSLKQCPKPRDSAAVNNARKQHKSKRNQNPGSRNAIRYYQSSQGGKFDDLKPGAVGAETRQLLGLGKYDPPPWLNRMREIGYPAGYLAPDDEDQPSGITIYADGDINMQEDGEIRGVERPQPQMKMTVDFPGINAPIPEEADASLWTVGASGPEPSRVRSHHRSYHSFESGSRGYHHEQRWSEDYEDDGPPGVDRGSSLSMSYPPRYSGHDCTRSFHSTRDHIPRARSPVLGRSLSDRRSPLRYDDVVSHGSHSSSYLSDRWTAPREYGSARYDKEFDYRLDDYRWDYDYDRYRHHRWR